jgi:hypothetical protein
VEFIKELVNSGKKEYNKILKDIWKLSGISSEQYFEPSPAGLNDLLNKPNGGSN